jgi:HAD superfamily hydrolase (TIGR01509 family)
LRKSQQPAGVVFDMDGTLLDTERIARACFLQACADIGWSVDITVYDRCVGATWVESERIMRTGFGAEFPYEAMDKRWSELYHAHVHHKPVDIKAGVLAVLQRLSDLSLPLAVATSSRRATVEKKLALAGIDHHFDFLVCGGETPRGKPHADPYLAAIAELDLQAHCCWAVEDSDNGVRSAVAAGLMVFQIPDEMAPSDEVCALGHEVLTSATDLLPRLAESVN